MLLLGFQLVVECIICFIMCPLLLMVFMFDLYSSDYMDAVRCKGFLLCFRVLPGFLHGISVLLTIGLLLHRYIIVSYPLQFKRYNKIRYVIGFSVFAVIFVGLFFIPNVYGIVTLPTVLIGSKLDSDVMIETAVMYSPINQQLI